MNRIQRDEFVSKEMVAVLRKMTPDQRLQMIWKMWAFSRRMVYDMAKHQHPDWSEEELQQHVAKRMARDAE